MKKIYFIVILFLVIMICFFFECNNNNFTKNTSLNCIQNELNLERII
ncbi:hypothetical protein WG909_06535 [Peptostreptococcaceae bacterium AGR-M142]